MWYSTGTVAVTNSSAIVTGTGTNFRAGAVVGHGLNIAGATFEIVSVQDETHLTLAKPYPGATATGVAYSITPTQSLAMTTLGEVRELVESFGPFRGSVADFSDLIDDRANDTLAAKNLTEAARDQAVASAAAAEVDRIAAVASATASAASQTAAATSAATATGQTNIVTAGRKLASATIALAFPKQFDPALIHAGIAYVGNAFQVTSIEDQFPAVVDAGRNSVTVPMSLGGTNGAQIGLNALVAYTVGRTYRFYADVEAVAAGAETALQCGFYARLQDSTYGAAGNITLTTAGGSAIIPVGSRQVITRDFTITSATGAQVWMRPGLLINRSPATIGSNLLGSSTRIYQLWVEDITDRTSAASSATAAAASATSAAVSAATAASFDPALFMPKAGGTFTGTVTAPTFSGALTGNASTATALAAGRTIGMTGDVTWTSAAFNGSGNVTGTSTIGANRVTLAMMQQTATATILGRSGAGTGNVEQLTAAQAKTILALGNVENKSSVTIRSEITSANVTAALGFTPFNTTRITISAAAPSGGVDGDIWMKI